MTDFFRRLPPLATLIVFEAAYRHQSFTRAANELALSQASVSRRVRELEESLGIKLFERARYDVVPTTDGEAFAITVGKSLQELAVATERLRERSSDLQKLTIFSDISLAHALLVPVVDQLQGLHRKMQVRIIASSEPIDSVYEDFDFGLQYGYWGEKKFTITPLADEVLFPVCSPEFAAKLSIQISPKEMAGLPLLHFSETGRVWPDWKSFFSNFHIESPEPVDGLVFSSYQICLDVAEQSRGIALGWGRSVRSRIAEGKLVRVSTMKMELRNAVNLYEPKNGVKNPLVADAIKLLRAGLQKVDNI